jgi:L-alanine-DL-glutamate epimerase-like enolase superfamily enzyme
VSVKATRRRFLEIGARTSLLAIAPGILRLSRGKPTDIRVEAVTFDYEAYRYRTPYKFGGTPTDRVTILNVRCTVRNRAGKVGHGRGSMPLGNVWSFPSKVLTYDQTLGAMKALTTRIRGALAAYPEYGHPIDITYALENSYLRSADIVGRELQLAEPVPKLCTLVVASPFDAALHDAFGKLHRVSSYHTYGPEFMTHDLATYLDAQFEGEMLDRYVRRTPAPRLPLYHSVGASDPIEDGDVDHRIGDGLPETLAEWIPYNGITNIKIKLDGNDLAWDIDRVLHINRVTAVVQTARGVDRWVCSLDFNERCPNVEYLLDFLQRVKAQDPAAFDRIQYIEQPTARDLRANPENVMHEAARIKPVVIDESLTDYESLMLSRKMGYSGAALKACKGQSQALILGAAGQKHKLFLCVQDLTCPGAALIHSAGLAAHIPTVVAIEANAREYVPAANRAWEARYPGIFKITDGTLDTSTLTHPGLGTP